MRLNHLDLQVPDVPATAQFLAHHFGLSIVSNPRSPAIIIMSDDAGLVLVLQRRRSGEGYPEGFHIGFLVDDAEAVRQKQAQLTRDGVACSAVEVNSRGVIFYLTAPGDITVEVSWRGRAKPTQ
jgi:catechol 2,3-dioxygenase-like lactoylglutathione lyase family enzyme